MEIIDDNFAVLLILIATAAFLVLALLIAIPAWYAAHRDRVAARPKPLDPNRPRLVLAETAELQIVPEGFSVTVTEMVGPASSDAPDLSHPAAGI